MKTYLILLSITLTSLTFGFFYGASIRKSKTSHILSQHYINMVTNTVDLIEAGQQEDLIHDYQDFIELSKTPKVNRSAIVGVHASNIKRTSKVINVLP